MTKNKFLKIRVNEEDLFKITESAGRENKKISEYVLGRILSTSASSPVNSGIDTDTLEFWGRLGEGINEYLSYSGKSLEVFMADIMFYSAKSADPVAWAAYVVERMKTQGTEKPKEEKGGVWYSPNTGEGL